MVKTEKRADVLLRHIDGIGFVPAEKEVVHNVLAPGSRPFVLKDGEIIRTSPVTNWSQLGGEIRFLTVSGSEYVLPDAI